MKNLFTLKEEGKMPARLAVATAFFIALLSVPVFGNPGNIVTVAGGGVADGGNAVNAPILYPGQTAFDSAGNMFVADTYHCLIRKVNTAGVITTVAGNGTCGFSGDGQTATTAQLSYPSGIAVDQTGSLYIADQFNARIRKVTAGVITTVAGNGTAGFAGDNGPATSAMLSEPSAVWLDSAANMYIADNGRIRRVDAATGSITTIAGGFNGDGGHAIDAPLTPQNTIVDSLGNIYFVDPAHSCVRKVDASPSRVITTFAGTGTSGFSGDGDAPTSAALSYPSGIAMDGSGNMYIADTGNNRIRKVTAGAITTVAGNGTRGYSGDGGPAISASLNGPFGVAVDASGNIYIADTYNNRIRKVDVLSGLISTVAGMSTPGFAGDGGAATSASLSSPGGVAVDLSGNIYIADTNNSRIRKVDISGLISTVAGTTPSGYSGDGGPANSASLHGPRSVAVDGSGTIYIADTYNNRIRKVDGISGLISTVAGTTTPGFSGDGGTAASASLSSPGGVAVDAAGSNIYIADTNNNRIRIVDSSGDIKTIAGNGTSDFFGDGGQATSAALGLGYGSGGAVDASGNIYIADSYNNRVRKIDTAGVIITIAGNGTCGYAGDGAAAVSAQLCTPSGIAVDSKGSVYIADTDNNCIRKVNSSGIIKTVAGNHALGYAYAGDGGPAKAASLNYPSGVTVNPAGDIFIADSNNNRIRKVSLGIISTVAGNGTQSFGGDGRAATSAALDSPWDVFVNKTGNIFIADTNNARVRKVTPAGGIKTVAGNGTSFSGDGGPAKSAGIDAFGVSVDSSGNIYLADIKRIRKVNTSGIIQTVAGTGTRGYGGDDGPATKALLNYPRGIAADSSGNIYIADSANNRIRKVNGQGVVSTVAGNGTADFNGDTGPATSASLNNPNGVAVDSSGNIYIADSANNRIRKVDEQGIISTVAGNGTADFSGDTGPAVSASLANPYGVAVDSSGTVYIADTDNSRIRKVDAMGVITTVAGNGMSDFSGDNAAAVSASLYNPRGISVDSSGNIYIADWGNNRVRKVIISDTPDSFSFPPAAGVMPGSSVTSDSSTVSGITIPVPVVISGGRYSINNGPLTDAAGTVNNGETVRIVIGASIDYGVTTTALLSIGTVSAVFSVTTQTAVVRPLDQAPDTTGNPAVLWATGGDAPWFDENVVYYDGGSAIQSGRINNGQSSWLQATLAGPATVSFYEKVSSEPGNDGLAFYVDDLASPKYTITGSVDWEQKIFTIPTGTHTLIWKYSKNASVTKGTDAAWVDKFMVSPNLALRIIAPSGNAKLFSGETMTVMWNAPAGAEKYKISYSTDGGVSYVSLITDTSSPGYPYYVPGPGFNDLTFTTTVPTPPTGNKSGCKIRLKAYNEAGLLVGSVVSDLAFKIIVVELTDPNGGLNQILSTKTTPIVPVMFTVYGQPQAASAVLFSSLDGGVTWLADPAPALALHGSGTYTFNWNLPVVTSIKKSRVKVIIKSAGPTITTLGKDSSDADFTIIPVFSVSGMVSGPTSTGVTVHLSGDEDLSVTTDSSGAYSFANLLPGNYMVSASKPGFIMSPVSVVVAVTSANVAGKNFSSTASDSPTHSISGTVSGATATVTIKVSGRTSGAVLTASDGTYRIDNLPEGSYTVTPVKTGYAFNPVSQGVYLLSDTASIDFTSTPGTAGSFSISGQLTYGAAGLPGALVTVSGVKGTASTVTDSSGNYMIKGIKNGMYSITPSLVDYFFTPGATSNTISGSSLSGVNFSATSLTRYDSFDLAGLWRSAGIKTPVKDTSDPLKFGYDIDRLVLGADGSGSNTPVSSSESVTPSTMPAGTFTLMSDGTVSGAADDFRYMNRHKDVMALLSTNSSSEQQLFIQVKQAPAYSSSDLAGTWYAAGITTPVFNTDNPANFGYDVVRYDMNSDASGTATWISSSDPIDPEALPAGWLSLSADGTMSDGDPNSYWFMNADKDVMYQFFADPVTSQQELIIHLKQGTSYSASDLAGTWHAVGLKTPAKNNSNSANFGYAVNQVVLDPDGSGTITSDQGGTTALLPGSVTITNDGVISDGNPNSYWFMNAGKNVMYQFVIDTISGGEQLFLYVKQAQ